MSEQDQKRREVKGLTLERREQKDETKTVETASAVVEIAPVVTEDYWLYRVRLSEAQAIVGFPKFGTVGIGFAVEEDWNTNLPYTCDAEEIFAHVAHNKGDAPISDDACLKAIRLVQAAAREDRAGQFPERVS